MVLGVLPRGQRIPRLHPLLVVVAIAVGVVLAGIVGALLAVPVVLVVRA